MMPTEALVSSHCSLTYALLKIKAAGEHSDLQCSRFAHDDHIALAAARDALHAVVMEIVTKALTEDADHGAGAEG